MSAAASSSAADRCGADPRTYSVLSKEFVGDADGKLTSVKTVQVAIGADGSVQHIGGGGGGGIPHRIGG